QPLVLGVAGNNGLYSARTFHPRSNVLDLVSQSDAQDALGRNFFVLKEFATGYSAVHLHDPLVLADADYAANIRRWRHWISSLSLRDSSTVSDRRIVTPSRLESTTGCSAYSSSAGDLYSFTKGALGFSEFT